MSAETLSAVFILSNLLVIPLYGLMVFAPRWTFTKRLIGSVWSVAPPALLTAIFGFLFIAREPQVLTQFGQMLASAAQGAGFNVYLQTVQTTPSAALVMWLHAVAADVVMARWAYLDSQTLGLKAWQASIAILVIGTNGPLGFVIYVLMRQYAVSQRKVAVA